ncbi:hypothetical protein Tco_1525328 [Tanacetum coccineum]
MEDPRESFNELMDTPLDFSAFVMNRLKVDTLTPELLAGPTFELMNGSCKSVMELEYFFKEVYKATTDQLDWNNPEGRRVIPFDHFINNDLEYLSGGVSSRKYTTSVTKTKAADYGHIKWIKDLVLNSMWSQVESARDVYTKRKIIAVTNLQIVEWHNYKHLDWITIRRDDDKLYKFKEGDFNRLRIQDIEDMLLLLVQEKLTNLTVEARLAFNVSLRMFIRRIVIQRRVEDLQLGVESYQKKLNLTKSNTYRPDLKRREAYTAYSNPRSFIYQNKDKKNRLLRIDELHKFSDDKMDSMHSTLSMYYDYDAHVKGELLVMMKNSQKHAEFDESDTHVLERFDTSAGNHVKEILLKLNLPDHRILKDGGEVLKSKNFKEVSVTLIPNVYLEVLKLKNFKKDATLKLFKSIKQEMYEHVGPEVTRSHGGKIYKMAKQEYAWLMVSRCSKSHSRQDKEQDQDLKSMITTSNHKIND